MRPARSASLAAALLPIAAVCAVVAGCASPTEWVSVRATPHHPMAARFDIFRPDGARLSRRTEQMLRRYDLRSRIDDDWRGVIADLEALDSPTTRREHQYTIAEVAFLGASRQKNRDPKRAIELYSVALLYTYRYLFDDRDGAEINPYDPQFRGSCDLYNKSLEELLRLVQREGALRPGDRRIVATGPHLCQLDVELHSRGWHAEDFDRAEFVSDFQVNGLRNHYLTHGLGVPLIAIRRPHDNPDPAEQYYPGRLTFPLTAFLRILEPSSGGPLPTAARHASPRYVLELRDPLDRKTVHVAGREAPLESDLSTPLAYFLNQPELREQDLSTLGLLRPDSLEALRGLYLLEPYDPRKMPVLMVHGLWSSPITWMEMYNDLRSDPAIRERYQFWTYLYPTGQPFWLSASQLRKELSDVRRSLDPHRRTPALDQMVLVGHSMGGLVSKMQSVESREDFWRINSDRPIQELDAEPEVYNKLSDAYFFRPDASVRRVVTIGTPHRGSRFANSITRWLGNQLIKAPQRLRIGREQLLTRNRGYFRSNSALGIKTSIDSLAPDSPLLPVLLAAQPGPWVEYHNIVGREPDSFATRWLGEEGDGVVSLASATLDGVPRVASQIVVPADHLSVHRHPQSILEVRRVLLKQLEELRGLAFVGEPRVLARQPPIGAPAVALAPPPDEPQRLATPNGPRMFPPPSPFNLGEPSTVTR